MNVQVGIWTWVPVFLAGWFFGLHPMNLVRDADLLYAWAVRTVHGEFRCPDNYECIRK